MIIKSILQCIKNNELDKNKGLKLIRNIKSFKEQIIEGTTFSISDIYVEGHQVFNEIVLLGATHISEVFNVFNQISIYT